MKQQATFLMLAKTFKGLEEVLAQELIELGANDVQLERRAVSFRGDMALLYRANLCLRTASRILVPIEVLHLFVTLQSLAIRRVEHHQRGSPTLGSSTDGHRQSDRAELFTRTREGKRIFDFFHADLFEFHILLHTGGFDIFCCLLDGIERGI